VSSVAVHKDEVAAKAVNWHLLGWLLRFLRPTWQRVAFALALTLITTVLGPLRPWLVKETIDGPVASGDTVGIFQMVALVLGVLVLHGALQYLLTVLMESIGQRTIYNIRMQVYRHLLRLNQRFFDLHPVGRLLTRVTNDVEALKVDCCFYVRYTYDAGTVDAGNVATLNADFLCLSSARPQSLPANPAVFSPNECVFK